MATSDVEVVNTEVTTLGTSSGLAVEQQREAGLNALARMSDTEFVERMKSLRVGLDRFDMMMGEVLKVGSGPDADLRTIEGVEKPVLTLSGAEKICFVARLAPTFTVTRATGTPPESPAIHYLVNCDLHLGNSDGPVVAQGVGSCNSHERKYRWRYAEKHCPKCGVIGALILSKWEAKGGDFKGLKPWVCLRKRGGCGAEFDPQEPLILSQRMGMVENPDPLDLDNTVLKMAKKRAFVDASKTATASSGRVTVDLDDGAPGTDEAEKLRAAIMDRVKALGWKARGDLWTVVKKCGFPVNNMEQFGEMKADDLSKVLLAMPKPTAPDDSEEPLVDDDIDVRDDRP